MHMVKKFHNWYMVKERVKVLKDWVYPLKLLNSSFKSSLKRDGLNEMLNVYC